MGRIKPAPEVRAVENIDELKRFVSSQFTSVNETVNGKLTFQDNISCKFVSSSIPKPTSGDAFVTLTHNLGFVPTGYIIVSQSRPVSVYSDTALSTTENIFLRVAFLTAGTDPANLNVMVF